MDIWAYGNEVFYELYKHEVPVVHLNQVPLMKRVIHEELLVNSLVHHDLVLYDPFTHSTEWLYMDSYTFRTEKSFDVAYLTGKNVRYYAMVSFNENIQESE